MKQRRAHDILEDEVLTTREVADRLGLSTRTVQEWARSGRLPNFRTRGGHRRFLASEIVAIKATGLAPAA